jgi:hypothetical protein
VTYPSAVRRIGILMIVVIAAAAVGAAAATWNLIDFHVYFEAAQRLRDGEPLFPAGAQTDSFTYRYASWFAYAFVPLTFLPEGFVAAAWTAACVLALIAIVGPYVASRKGDAIAFGLICLTVLVWEAGSGNVGVILVALVMHTARGRFGPLAIGAFASLKFFPILYALAYVKQREWRRAGLALGIAIALAAPTLLEDLSSYPFSAGSTISLFGISPVLWGVALLAAIVMTLRSDRWTWSWTALVVLLSWTKMWPAAAYAGGLAIGPYNDGVLDRRDGDD